MEYIIPDKLYTVLKWVGLIALPAIATFVGTVGTACEWEFTGIAVTIITATGTFVGSIIGVSNMNAKRQIEAE